MAEFLDNWQTLVGSVLGGVFGLLVALVVARDARKREERAAAYFLISQLKAISIFGHAARAAEGLLASVEDALVSLHREHFRLINQGSYPTGGWGYEQVVPDSLLEARTVAKKAQRSLQELVLDSGAWHNRFQRKMRRIEALRDDEIGTPRS